MKKILLLLLTFSIMISLLAVLPSCARGISTPSSKDKKLLNEMMESCDWSRSYMSVLLCATRNPDDIGGNIFFGLQKNENFNEIMEKDNAIDLLLWQYNKIEGSLSFDKEKYYFVRSMYYLFHCESVLDRMTEEQIKISEEISYDVDDRWVEWFNSPDK